MGFPRQEYWSGFPFLPPGDFPDPGMELAISYVSCIGRWGFYQCITWEAHYYDKQYLWSVDCVWATMPNMYIISQKSSQHVCCPPTSLRVLPATRSHRPHFALGILCPLTFLRCVKSPSTSGPLHWLFSLIVLFFLQTSSQLSLSK